jgi:5-deoxy-D-glucuronate isomerase
MRNIFELILDHAAAHRKLKLNEVNTRSSSQDIHRRVQTDMPDLSELNNKFYFRINSKELKCY